MRTKEIECWVHPQFEDHWFVNTNSVVRGQQPFDYWLKARLIIDLPEKKIEITESQFDYAMGDIIRMLDGRKVAQAEEMKCAWKEKLFGKEEM